jgi:hypothetical protein
MTESGRRWKIKKDGLMERMDGDVSNQVEFLAANGRWSYGWRPAQIGSFSFQLLAIGDDGPSPKSWATPPTPQQCAREEEFGGLREQQKKIRRLEDNNNNNNNSSSRGIHILRNRG